MMTIKNKDKKVLVLKAFGLPVLRLLPGLNSVDADSLLPYVKDNKAATAMVKESLEVIDSKLSPVEQAEADSAKAKNDKLNKSAVLLKKAQEDLSKAKDGGKVDAKVIKELNEKMAALEKSNKEAMELIESFRAEKVMDAAEKDLAMAEGVLADATTDPDKVKATKAITAAKEAIAKLKSGK